MCKIKTINLISKLSQISINLFFIQIIEDSKIMNYSFFNKNLFLTYTFVDNQIILETKYVQQINAEKRETVCLLLKNEDEKETELISIDVLYVSKLNCNLMNISRFTKKELEIFLLANKSLEIYHQSRIIDLMDLKNDLYVLRTKSMKVEILTMKTKSSIQFWHDRMRHLKYKNLMKLNHLTDERNIVDFISEKICDNYMIERQQRKRNRTFKIRTNVFLNIVHSDLRKSFFFTRKNERYYVVFNDDFINV